MVRALTAGNPYFVRVFGDMAYLVPETVKVALRLLHSLCNRIILQVVDNAPEVAFVFREYTFNIEHLLHYHCFLYVEPISCVCDLFLPLTQNRLGTVKVVLSDI